MKSSLIWLLEGGAIPALLCISGLFFLFYLKGYPFRTPRRMVRAMMHRSGSGVSPFRAVTLALAGTLGVGNIVGVANALWLGGAGALFWMWVSALLAMLLKYAEILLAVSHRRTAPDGSHSGGAVRYIRDRFPSRAGTVLAAVFGLLTVLDAWSMGCVIQVNAVASALHGTLGMPLPAVGILLLLISVPIILRSPRAVSALTEYLVPIMSLGYLVLSVAVLILRRAALPEVLASVFREAFRPQSALGGAAGFLTSRALRVGTMRGLLSNEAGCGTAPTAHACAATDSPASQGVWGIFEVFADTILLCTVTALVILVSFPSVRAWGDDAVMMTISAYTGVLGGWAKWFFCAAVFCFGYATVICWAGYGREALRAITRRKLPLLLYLLVFALCIPLGAVLAPSSVWAVSDFAIASMTAINLFVLLACRREIRSETLQRFEGENLGTPSQTLQSPFLEEGSKNPKNFH